MSGLVRPVSGPVRWRRPATVLPVLLVLALLAVAGVALARRPGDGADPPAAQVRLRATVEQWRQDEVAHTVQIALHNDGPQPVRVSRVHLLAPSFTPVDAVATDAILPPGGLRVDLETAYGQGRCADVTTDAQAEALVSAAARVELAVAAGGSPAYALTIALPHPDDLLDRLLRDECRRAVLGRVVTVGFGPWRRVPSGGLAGSVVLTRVGTAQVPITLTDLAGSVTYVISPVPADRPRPLGVLAAGRTSLAVPVLARPDRCTGHVFGEAKKPFVFPAWLSLDGGPPLYIEIAVDGASRAELTELTSRECHPTS